MGSLGKVCIGQKAPDFHCEAVVAGEIKEVSLSTYISEENPQWLIILFIPAAFSFVCPTEVLAFQNCLAEFYDRNCSIVFVSVDTKHSLWHWQNVPAQYGGLGRVSVPLLSDASHKMSRDYGVLIEKEGICLRGMFILDNEAVVQQITLNNLTVGRSVLEALRLLEAFKAVQKHGVLCPIDWKPSTDAQDTLDTISNTLTEDYHERLANLQKDFGDVQVTDLDAKYAQERRESTSHFPQTLPRQRSDSSSTRSAKPSPEEHIHDNSNTMPATCTTPTLANPCPLPKPPPPTSQPRPQPQPEKTSSSTSSNTSAPHSHPSSTKSMPTRPFHTSQSQSQSQSNRSSTSNSTHSSISNPALSPLGYPNWESRRGSQVLLEFAEPTLSSPPSGASARGATRTPSARNSPSLSRTAAVNMKLDLGVGVGLRYPGETPTSRAKAGSGTGSASAIVRPPTVLRAASLSPLGTPRVVSSGSGSGSGRRFTPPMPSAVSFPFSISTSAVETPWPSHRRASGNWNSNMNSNMPWASGSLTGPETALSTPKSSPAQQTRLQATFDAIKKMSAGLGSPRFEARLKKGGSAEGKGSGSGSRANDGWGYFDVVVEEGAGS